MAHKLILDDLSTLQNETSATNKINENMRRIEAAIENTLSRDGTLPNSMRANLDMNSNRILNLPAPSGDTEPVRLGDVEEIGDFTVLDSQLMTYTNPATGALERTIEDRLAEKFSVLDFIPASLHAAIVAGTSSTDLTTYIQAAIDYIETITFDSFKGFGRPAVHFPAGKYTTDSLTADKHMEFVGDGKGATLIVLKSGSTTSLFTLNAEDVLASTADDTNHYAFRNLSLLGNRTSAVPGTAHCINCPDTTWSIAAQYSPSVILQNVEIYSFTGTGVLLGDNRNWFVADNTIIRYCNIDGLASEGYDFFISNSIFGNCEGNGWKVSDGGAHSIANVNMFFNGVNNLAVESLVDEYITWQGGDCGFAGTDGLALNSPTNVTTISGVMFRGNSRTSASTDSDIKVTGSSAKLKLIGDTFKFNTNNVAYLLEFSGTTPDVEWIGNHIDSGTSPFATAVTNDFTKLLTTSNAGIAGKFVNTTDNALVQVISLEGDRATPADLDSAYTSLKLSNNAGTQTEFARQAWQRVDNTNGQYILSLLVGGVLTQKLVMNSTVLAPVTNDGLALGTTALGWADLHGATGFTWNIANGNWLATHTSGIMTVTTGDLRVTNNFTNAASVVTVGGSQTLTNKTLTSPVIGTSPTAAGATWTDLGTVTTADINGGTIDGTVIGGASAVAGTFTNTVATGGAIVGFSGTPTADQVQVGDANLYLGLVSGVGTVQFDSTDMYQYDRTNNNLQFKIGDTLRYFLDNRGTPLWAATDTTPISLSTNGWFTLTPTSNTNFRISYRGSDGVTRVGNITLA